MLIGLLIEQKIDSGSGGNHLTHQWHISLEIETAAPLPHNKETQKKTRREDSWDPKIQIKIPRGLGGEKHSLTLLICMHACVYVKNASGACIACAQLWGKGTDPKP